MGRVFLTGTLFGVVCGLSRTAAAKMSQASDVQSSTGLAFGTLANVGPAPNGSDEALHA